MILQEEFIQGLEGSAFWEMIHQLSDKSDKEASELSQLNNHNMTIMSGLKEMEQPGLLQDYLKTIESVNKSNIYKSTSIFIFFNKRYANKIKFIVILFLQFLSKKEFFPLRLELLQNDQLFLDFQSNMDIKAFDMVNLEIIAILFRKTVYMHSLISCNRLERLVITGRELDPQRQTTLDSLVEEFVQQNSSSFNFEFPIKEIHLFKTKKGAFSAMISYQTKQLIDHMQASVISSIMDSINSHIKSTARKVVESAE